MSILLVYHVSAEGLQVTYGTINILNLHVHMKAQLGGALSLCPGHTTAATAIISMELVIACPFLFERSCDLYRL